MHFRIPAFYPLSHEILEPKDDVTPAQQVMNKNQKFLYTPDMRNHLTRTNDIRPLDS